MVFASLMFESRYSDILEFVRDADVVVTYVTNYDHEASARFLNGREHIRQFNQKNPDRHFRRFDKGERSSLIWFLKHVAASKGFSPVSCFNPHHFLVATNGRKHLEFQICFGCGGLLVDGSLNYGSSVNRGLLERTEKVFGMKFRPERLPDPVPAATKRDENKVEMSKGKG